MPDYESLDSDELLTACGILESTLIALINRVEELGLDANEFHKSLNDAHMAVNELANL